MITNESIKYISLAGIFKSAIEQIAGIAFNIIVLIAIVFIVIPAVGLPLAFLLHVTADIFDINREMARDAVTMMIGGLERALPMFLSLVLIAIGLRLWHKFIESRHGRIGLMFIVLATL